MLGILFVLLLGVPLLELYLIVQVAGAIGVLETIGLLLLISAGGAYLLKQQGIATWRRVEQMLKQNEMPGRELVEGAMILVGGALLLTPGFFTDAVGLLLLLPPTRAALRRVMTRLLARWGRARFHVVHYTNVYDAEVVDRQRPTDPRPPGELP